MKRFSSTYKHQVDLYGDEVRIASEYFNDLGNDEKIELINNAIEKLSMEDALKISDMAERLVRKVKDQMPPSYQFSKTYAYEILFKIGAGMHVGTIWVNGSPVSEVKNER